MDKLPEIIAGTIGQVIESERAGLILEISGFGSQLGEMVKNPQLPQPQLPAVLIDRIDLTDGGLPGTEGLSDACIYDNVYKSGVLSDISKLKQYDVIIIFHMFENMTGTDAKAILEALLTKANKQVLVITPEYPYDLESEDENKKSDVRTYHPVFFSGMDFSYEMPDTAGGSIQIYSFFPSINYNPLPEDSCNEALNKFPGNHENTRKLKIAYVLFFHSKTGAIKSIIGHIKHLSERGHEITVYYRQSVAGAMKHSWDIPEDAGIKAQVTVPENANYPDYIKNQDIIILSWMTLTAEFENPEIPVALWEQGSEALFGDYYGKVRSSSDELRLKMHSYYRAPVHLLAVSDAIRKILKGKYNREAQLFPTGVDTDLYYPEKNKENDIPVVLLVGNPGLRFKGFMLVFSVLDRAYKNGHVFKVQLATPMEFTLSPSPSFPFEIFIDPPQAKLAELYRNADIFISASLYESFALPPLEAMASGVAVIATDSGGINTYAESGTNCLLCGQGDRKAMLNALQQLIQSPGTRGRLAKAGRETALRFSHQNIVPGLERCLYKIAGSKEW